MAAASSTTTPSPSLLHSSFLAPPCIGRLVLSSREKASRHSRKCLLSSGAVNSPRSKRGQGLCWLYRPAPSYVVCCALSGSGGLPEDEFGMYPWDPFYASDDNLIEWVQEDTITLFTTDGLIQIGGSKVARQVSPERRLARGRSTAKFRRFREESYMDPKQDLCLGAIFNIAATNGLDLGRRFCIFGFCRSIEMLSDVVEDTVLEHGGEVVVSEKGSSGGLNEKLYMTVAMPLLWGIPPGVDSLNYAIRSGGGIVEKVYWQWEFF